MIDWQIGDGARIAVYGVRVGDRMDAIPKERITQTEPKGDANGVRDRGGRVFVGQICFRIAPGGDVEEIWVRGPELEGFPVASEADIERRLGRPSGVERTLGWVIRHYRERNLSVSWNADKGRLEGVRLGPVTWKEPEYGAEHLLQEYLAVVRLGVALDRAAPASPATHADARLARLIALCGAFGIGSPGRFADGSFVEGRPPHAFPRTQAAIAEEAQRFPSNRGRSVTVTGGQLAWFFRFLLKYRTNAEALLRVNDGWLEASLPFAIALIGLTQRANSGVSEALAPIEALLCEMISPEGKRFAESELVARFGWPEVDADHLRRKELWED